eukprot:scaffold26464_cov117-Cylindrotheca_fusiformis.AAC.2
MTEHDPTTATEPTHHVDPLGGAAEQGRAMNNITEAGSFARERATELKQSVLEGNCGLRILVLVGALAMMTTSIIGLVSDVYHIDTIGALIDIYCFILAVMMIILEYGYQLSFFAAIQPSLYKNALFLKVAGNQSTSLYEHYCGFLCVHLGLCLCHYRPFGIPKTGRSQTIDLYTRRYQD